ncbi:MAG: ABC transporter permease subunit [Acidimicrobiia bacterium]|nr:ABC transporter permease subunit [Acidimicrobiia bacterium]
MWYLISYVAFEPQRRFLVPPPHRVLYTSFWEGVTGSGLVEVGKKVLSDVLPGAQIDADVDSGVYFLGNLEALWNTIKVAVVGLAEAIVFGTLAAVVMSQARWVERSVFPWLLALMATPILAIAPLIGTWFGYGFNARTLVTLIISFFPIANNTLFGLLSAEEGQHDLFTLHGASRWTRLVKLQAPSALPAFFVALRNAAGLAVIGSIVGDFVFGRGEPGLGERLRSYFSRIDNEALFGAIILSTMLGISFYLLFDWVGRRAIGRWHGARER